MELTQENVFLLITSGSIALLLLGIAFIWLTRRNFKLRMKHEKALFRLVLEAQEKERHRISRDLHDGIGTNISYIKVMTNAIKTEAKEESGQIENLTKTIDTTLKSMRTIISNLRPHEFSKMGLEGALKKLEQDSRNNFPFDVSFELTGMNERLTDEVEINIYRIIQELVNNSLKHSEGKNISLSMKMNDKKLAIDYSDDGKGFSPEKITPGMGLGNIKARVDLFRGTMHVDSSPGKGINCKIHFQKNKLNI